MDNTSRIVNFKANASVKDIVGRGLIYDDNIAIIELVKNAKDASSPDVKIKFENETTLSDESKLIIADSGKGMTLTEIRNKWLNIAYSEKKGNLLNNKSAYAGNKGVGRFSCDRLGRELVLYTKSPDGEYLKLPINWELFEDKGQDDEISTIPLTYEVLGREVFLSEIKDPDFEQDFEQGTVLVIKKLRSEWTTAKLAKLMSELEKFSPSLDEDFEVYLYSSSFHPSLKNKLNRKINKNILDKLIFKTTYIKSKIDASGEKIDSTLYYQGEEVYSYTANNPYRELKNISMEVHFLDPLSKSYFTKNVGISPNRYGSVFLFYNGFRVSPYGNEKNDWLGLDQRKSQGTARNLGTREIIGRIDITDPEGKFSVITSREGLAHNKAYFELVAFDFEEKATLRDGTMRYGFVTTIIRQLENFVVYGLEWNRLMDRFAPPDSTKVITERDVKLDPSRYHLKEISPDKVEEACKRILKSGWVIDNFLINDELIDRLSDIAIQKYNQFVDDFVENSAGKLFRDLSPSEKGAFREIIEQERLRTEKALADRDLAEVQRDIAEQRAATEKKRSLFLEELADPAQTLDALITHVVKQLSGAVEADIKTTLAIYYRNPDAITKEDLIDVLENTIKDIAVIKESATMASKAGFNLKVTSMHADLYEFLEEYIGEIASKKRRWRFKIHFENQGGHKLLKSFAPGKITVFIVNILDNAKKMGIGNLYISCFKNKITFTDDGPGFDFRTYSEAEFLSKGMSTSDDGSGLGLYHCRLIAEEDLGGKVLLSNDPITNGAKITLEL